MSLEMMIYLADVGENLRGAFGFVSGVLAIVSINYTIISLCEEEFDKKMLALLVVPLVVFGTIAVLVPSKTTIYSIAAIKMGKEISKNEKVIETSDKIYKLLNQKLDGLLEEKPK